ncbi:alpha-tubulin N-acetyltransferase 1 isoform X1 [Lucilia sericata]|uniref:alpha-tubulin N-acetyltransferase 1 isoform X1 n=1 Tax=Lucilia sericata TaxID=13632 RepID=UPI0018A82920|nr:alpha-tubulin N-acetyltransferase 1 isoform X1 [Lucilia sericata]XP_037815692.1 alpha-tubulin N-acetyltransferase 1 isoform X1 [Lucilia sericata]XP_037815693.1 alpha-tubulin N-acetyltransferase 1 isoform X1 [Lucilia sericata]XP_037815695.1 alpha-tubulin N-acetyltransferase 1 isoform X1 [Lucilia sericata]XP_037815696.1 alpha-tubulin N-acetyltransferase 1 isoform X1 [Lucilia sericata]
MVEFRFDLSPLFTQPIVKVTSNLLPHTFRGDRRQCLDATSKMSEIIDHLGQLSASAQKLSKPVTTAQRLRMSENQTIYLMADVNAGKNGCVIGLLKVGTKDLYLFDETGQTRKVENAPSILDFYIHESRQRAGLGKDLFETMLADENWTPVKCSVDRPSEKLLGFLKKHYGLVRTIPQSNNFVLYEGFFDDGNKQQQQQQQHTNGGMHITNSPNTQLFGATYLGDENNKKRSQQRQLDAPNLSTQITQISPVGRYGARRPTCSMAEIIHSGTTANNSGAEPGSKQSPSVEIVNDNLHNLNINDHEQTEHEAEQPQSHDEVDEDLQTQAGQEQPIASATDANAELEISINEHAANEHEPSTQSQQNSLVNTPSQPSKSTSSVFEMENRKTAPTFHLSKQHTGMKNRSYGVGMAVTPSTKMEFDQELREDFGVVKINRPIGKQPLSPNANEETMSTVSSSGEGLTDQGYYDLKFYHNKLW